MVTNVTDHTLTLTLALTLTLTYSEIGHHRMTLCPIKNLLTMGNMDGAYGWRNVDKIN